MPQPEVDQIASEAERQIEAIVSMRWGEPHHGDMHEAVRQVIKSAIEKAKKALEGELAQAVRDRSQALMRVKELSRAAHASGHCPPGDPCPDCAGGVDPRNPAYTKKAQAHNIHRKKKGGEIETMKRLIAMALITLSVVIGTVAIKHPARIAQGPKPNSCVPCIADTGHHVGGPYTEINYGYQYN